MNINKLLSTSLLGTALLAGCADAPGIGKIEILRPDALMLESSSFKEGNFAGFEAFLTGWVKAPANILIDQDHIGLPEDLRSDQWVPAIAYAVNHPQFGTVILDLGVEPGDCDFGIRPVYTVPCTNTPGSDLASQLEAGGARGEDVKFIIPSHFHGDHVSGLENFLQHFSVPLIMTEAALAEIKSPLRALRGIENRMLQSALQIIIMDDHTYEDDLLGTALDLFGDQSLLIFTTPGHTDGHISAIVNTRHEKILLTFDAAHLQANYELTIPSGAVTHKDLAINSLKALQKIERAFDIDRVIFGHEPSQWCLSGTAPIEVQQACQPRPGRSSE